jgi:exodeoxyribonuclease V alpha subunit
MPSNLEAMAEYMATDKEFRGIGRALASRLVQRFGKHLRDALAEKDHAIIELLGYDLAERTFAVFETKRHEADFLDWIEQRGLSDLLSVRDAVRIARCWGMEGLTSLFENPYLLVAFLPWKTVDAIGKSVNRRAKLTHLGGL